MRLVLRGREPRWVAPAAVGVAVLLTAGADRDPDPARRGESAGRLPALPGHPVDTPAGLYEVLLTATPLLFTGIAVALAFRVGYWNIGAEGQFLAGAIGTTAVGIGLPGLPPWWRSRSGSSPAPSAGWSWATLPAWLKRHGGIDEVVTTLLLNPVALLLVQGLLNGPGATPAPGSPTPTGSGTATTCPPCCPAPGCTGASASRWWWSRSPGWSWPGPPPGSGSRPPDRRRRRRGSAGIPVGMLQWRCALVSGAIAGLGGASQVMGVQHQLTSGISNNYGYTGIIVATLAGLSAFGVLLVAGLLGDIAVGAQNVSLVLQVPTQLGEIFGALLLVMVLSMMTWRRYRLGWRSAVGPR